MKKSNILSFRVFGRRALFTVPENRMGGEKFTYHIPTPEAVKGIMESIFWKPTIQWVVRRVRVINQIQTESVGIKPLKMNGGNDLSYYTYLKDVEYEVEVNFKWNENRPDLSHDRNENKYYFMAKRSIERGGRRDVFLGTRECQAYVEPCVFGEKKGYYDDVNELGFGLQFYGFTYPDEVYKDSDKGVFKANFWNPIMRNGIIDVINPDECEITRTIREMDVKQFILGNNMISIDEEVKQFDMD